MGLVPTLAVSLGLLASPPALASGDCDEFGQINPEERVVYTGETATFHVAGGPSCGDVSACQWWVDDDLGDLSSTTGSPVTWTAPEQIQDCLPQALRIYVQCADVTETGSASIDLRCTDAELDALMASRGTTVSGGGCATPSAAGLLLLPLLGIRRRRG